MQPNVEYSLKQSFAGVKSRSSPLVEEALKLGCSLRSVEAVGSSVSLPPNHLFFPSEPLAFSSVKLPCGHRFFSDCYREQEARTLDWLIDIFPDDGWFVTFTFHDYIFYERAGRRLARWFSCLNQSYFDVNSAGLLKSVSSVEWQQRDVIHYHSLVFGKGLGCLSRKRWESRWQREGGGYCRIYEADKEAAEYLVKHQIKDRPESALHLGGSWRDISLPKSLSRCCGMALNGSSSVGCSSSGVQSPHYGNGFARE